MSLQEMIYLWERSEQGDVQSLMVLSVEYNNAEGVRYNPEISFSLIERAAKTGNAEAKWRYGYHKFYGIGCSVNQDEGRMAIQESIDKGNEYAKELLAQMEASLE